MKMIEPSDCINRFTGDADGKVNKSEEVGAKESKDLVQG